MKINFLKGDGCNTDLFYNKHFLKQVLSTNEEI